MANTCYFVARISGNKEAAKELALMFPVKEDGKYLDTDSENFLEGRIYYVYISSEKEDELIKGLYHIEINGECAHSLNEMVRYYSVNLLSETKRLGVAIELWGNEVCNEFEQHFMIDSGKLLLDGFTYYSTYDADDFEKLSEEEKNQIASELRLDIDNVNIKERWDPFLDDCIYYIGGYGDEYGTFTLYPASFKQL